MPSLQKNFIFDGIRFILTHNIFTFDDQLFFQTCGTLMGMKFAPSYANIFMGNFENTMIFGSKWSENIITVSIMDTSTTYFSFGEAIRMTLRNSLST